MKLRRRTPKEKPHRCKVPKDTDSDSVFRCICGLRYMWNGKWTTADYQLRYLDGPDRWSLWLRRYNAVELARMPNSSTRDGAKDWVRQLFLADDLEILRFSTYGGSNDTATTFAISYSQVAKGLRAIARSEMP